MPTAGTYPRLTWAIRPDALTRDIRATINGVAATVQLATVGPYYWRGDATALDACLWLQTALATHPAGPAVAVTISQAGLLSAGMDMPFTIAWGDALTTADPRWFGEVAAASWADLVGPPYLYTHTRAAGHGWWPGEWYDDDSGSEAGYQVSRSETLGGRVDVYRWSARSVRRISVSFLPAERVFSAEATTGETFTEVHAAASQGEPIEWTPDVTVPATYLRWHIADEAWLSGWPMERPIDRFARYSVAIPLIGYVP